MLLLLSPSKTQDFDSALPKYAADYMNEPVLLKESEKLIKELRKYKSEKLQELMDISEKLAALNYQRYQQFHTPFNADNARPAIYAFKGDVYDGLDAESLTEAQVKQANKHLCILSGLYGLLHGCDLIQPYRLEMKIPLKNARGKDLYAFWGEKITQQLNARIAETDSKAIINLASGEYFKAVHIKKLKAPLTNVHFKEAKGNQLKVIGLFAKKARGQMARFILKQHIDNLYDIRKFNEDGYLFDEALSCDAEIVFVRRQ